MKIVLWIGNQPNQKALANKIVQKHDKAIDFITMGGNSNVKQSDITEGTT